MTDPKSPNSSRDPKGSLWTTPASESASLFALRQPLVDENVTAENIREAVDATKERAAAFSGRVSDELLRASVE
jgi:hypothetical protein